MLDDNNDRESERWVDCGRSYPPLLRSTHLGKPHQPLLPTRLTFECQTDLWRGSNFAHHRFIMIKLHPNNSWPLRVTVQTSRWRAHSGWYWSLQTDRQTKMLSKSTARECVDQKESHEIARSFGFRICGSLMSPFRIGWGAFWGRDHVSCNSRKVWTASIL